MTDNLTYTPGPWRVVEQDADGRAVIEGEDGASCVAYTAGWYREDGRNDGPGNAALIAAAPALLEAAKDALGSGLLHPDSHSAQALRAAIAKAEGGHA